MKYYKETTIKNNIKLTIRNGTENDAKEVLDIFNQTHSETDFLLTYTDENQFTEEIEKQFIKRMLDSEREIELLAIVDGKCVGTAGIESVGEKIKIKHRAMLGISVLKEYWGLGIGRQLMESCIECASKAEYLQIELDAVAANDRAVNLYKKVGFVEYGRNPLGFKTREGVFQEIVLMRREL